MSVSGDSLVQTPQGLTPVKLLPDTASMWSGNQWTTVSVFQVEDRSAALSLRTGVLLRVSPQQELLAHSQNDYTWKPACSLTSDDHICMQVSESGSELPEHYELNRFYWLGRLFVDGIRTNEGITFDLIGGFTGRTITLSEGIRTVARSKSWTLQLVRRGSGYIVVLRGAALESMLLNDGACFVDNQLASIPSGWMLASSRSRRALARGILESGKCTNRMWLVDVTDKYRARDIQILFASVGLNSQLTRNGIYVQSWAAGMELRSATPYPIKADLCIPPGAPYEQALEFQAAAERRQAGGRKLPPGPAAMVLASIKAGQSVTPVALRASWASLHSTYMHHRLFNTAPVGRILLPEDTEDMFTLEGADGCGSVAVNGCVLRVPLR
jgi:hypothetical protein